MIEDSADRSHLKMYEKEEKNVRTTREKWKIVTADSVKEGDIAVKDGKIAAILAPGVEVEAEKVIDAGGKYVFPGAIDTHAHLNDPGYEWREDYAHGTAAAAVGDRKSTRLNSSHCG